MANFAGSIGILVVRIVMGVIFIAHGAQKAFGVFGGAGLEKTAKLVESMGFAPPQLWAILLAWGELMGGIFIILGIIPRISSGVIAVIMLVAIFGIHLSGGLFMSNGGFEYPLLILAVCVFMIVTGSGKYSLLNKF